MHKKVEAKKADSKRFQLILAHRARNIGKVAIPGKNVIGMQISFLLRWAVFFSFL